MNNIFEIITSTDILQIILPCLYIYSYWRNEYPPLDEIISPMTTLLYLFDIRQISMLSSVIALSIIVDSIADFYMDGKNLLFPVMLFSLGHAVKQSVYVMKYGCPSSIISLSMIMFLNGMIFYNWLKPYTGELLLYIYGLIIGISFIGSCIINQTVDIGYLIFIISDIIIAVDLMKKIYPRQIRIILVPVLYWLAQKIIIMNLLK